MDQAQAESSAAAAARSAKAALRREFKMSPKSGHTENPTDSPTNNPASNSTENPTDNPNAESSEDPWGDIRKFSKHKSRSLDTSRNDHLPKILAASQAISVVFLGDSMIERMTTTGKTSSLQLWPSETMISEEDLENTNLRRRALHLPELVRISGLLNAGCGGDKIENILFRLIGDPDQDLPGLAESLSTNRRQRKIKLWVVQAGTNNLHPKKGLTDASVEAYRALLESILDISDESTCVMVTGLFYRKDIKNELVAQANAKLKKLVHDLAWEFSPDSRDLEPESTEGVVSRLVAHTDAPQAVKMKGKGKAVDPEKRRDSAIGVSISPAVTREGAGIKGKRSGKDKAKEAPPGSKEGPPSTDRDPTMPQFKPNWWSTIFEKDPEAVGISRDSPASKRREFPGMAPTAWLSGHREADYNYPRIQFLPAPGANDPETWLEDHVHLHEEGYRLWTRKLFPKVKEMLTHAEKASP